MDDFLLACKEILAYILTPATFFGAGGGLVRAMRRRGDVKQIAAEMAGGILVANMVFPIVAEHLPKPWHYTVFFLVGWGGIEMVGWAYQSAVEFLRLWALRRAGLTVEDLDHLRHSDAFRDGDKPQRHERPHTDEEQN